MDKYFIVGKFVFPELGEYFSVSEFFQDVVYDKGGVAGFFDIIGVEGNKVEVKFERSHSEDDV